MTSNLRRLIAHIIVSEQYPAKTPRGPFKLGQFRMFKTLKERIQYLETRTDCQSLDYGSSRIVFFIENKKKVMKLALRSRGKAQNKTEADVALTSGKPTRKYLPQLFAKSPDYSWMIVEAVIPLRSAREFEELTGIPIRYITMATMYLTGAYKKASSKSRIRSKKIYDILSKKSPWFGGLVRMAKRFDLEPGDIAKWDSWGKTKRGRLVLIDYGLTPEIWKKYYTSSS